MEFLKIKLENVKSNSGKTKSIFEKLVSIFIPKANPDFENEIDQVMFWLLEFEDENSLPNREIGLDKDQNVLMKMPFNENYGYWIDNDFTFSDFMKMFDAEFITQTFFEEQWSVELK